MSFCRQVRSYRAAIPSRSRQAVREHAVPRVPVPNFCLGASIFGNKADDGSFEWPSCNQKVPVRLHLPEEEIAYGPACYLWDYLRRSGASGYFLPLSGGADSASTAAIVGVMCQESLAPT